MNYYVSTTGSNSNSGTLASPFATISYAISVSTTGDTVFVLAGTYAEYLVINKSITVSTYNNQTVLVQPGVGGNETVLIRDTSNVVLHGFIIDSVNNRRGVSVSKAHHVTIEWCEIKNCYGHAQVERGQGIIISADGICHHINIWHCNVRHVGGIPSEYGNCHGVYASCPYLEIRWSEFSYIDGNGLHFFGSAGGSVWIDSCYCHHNAIGIGVYYGVCLITNNVCRDNTVGLLVRASVVEANFYFNTCYNNIRGMDVNGLNIDAVVRIINNVFAHGDHAYAVNPVQGSVTIHHNLKSEMTNADSIGSGYSVSHVLGLFSPVVESNGIMRPNPTNPVIGAGVAIAGVTRDKDDRLRSTVPCIGAYEFRKIRVTF